MDKMIKSASFLLFGAFFLASCSTNSGIEKSSGAFPTGLSTSNNSEIDASGGTGLSSKGPEEKALAEKVIIDPEAAGRNLSFSTVLPLQNAGLPILETDLMNREVSDSELENVPELEVEPEEFQTQYDVPIVINESVENYLTYFNTRINDKFALWLERSGRFLPMMVEILREEGLPEDLVYISLIESGFNPYAYSKAKAVGAWQFIQSTGRIYGLKVNSWVDERRDPEKATRAAARHLKDLYNRFGSWPLAMAAYNAGERKISRALRFSNSETYWDIRKTRYIRSETKGYVPKYMAATIIAKNPDRYGYTLNYQEPFSYDTVTVEGSADLRVMAQAAGITLKELKDLNPELRTVLTPVYVKHYTLRLPPGKAGEFEEAYAKIPDHKKIIGTRYKIKKNDTLSEIASKFGTSVTLLREINNIPIRHILRIGDTVFIPKLPKSSRAHVISKNDVVTQGDKLVYKVRRGDTLWDISQSFNVSIKDIKRFNGMSRNIIRPGDLLVLGTLSKL